MFVTKKCDELICSTSVMNPQLILSLDPYFLFPLTLVRKPESSKQKSSFINQNRVVYIVPP